MRPIDKGDSPQVFTNYQAAKQFLASRLGTYCSFCERRITTSLAVEHILPKDKNLPYAHLENEWTNFLLSCSNCNSTKGTKILTLSDYLLPDRDNTFPYYEYLETGEVEASGVDTNIREMAQRTLDLVGLNNHNLSNSDGTLLFSELERYGQRIQAWVQAKGARTDYDRGEVNIQRIANEAAACGFFSIWMKAFEGVVVVRQALINAFGHTSTNCFDANTNPITPRPANTLENSGKS